MKVVSFNPKFHQLFKNVWVIIQNMHRKRDIGQKVDPGGISHFKYVNNWPTKG